MNQGKYVFAQLTEFLPRRKFDGIVEKYQGNKYSKGLTCWNQMLIMVFGQLTARESMRDLMLSLEPQRSKFYHLGFGNTVSRRNLGNANDKRDYRIFEEFAYVLIDKARKTCYNEDFEIKVDGNVYALDSSTVDLCMSIFWWAKFRSSKSGIKLHTLFDVKTSIPAYLYISETKLHDVNILDHLDYEAESFYVMDKAYVDFKRLYVLHKDNAYFVTRAKKNMHFRRMYSRKADKAKGVKYDQIGKLDGIISKNHYPEKLRRVKYYDAEKDRDFVFITNNMTVEALEIAALYKERWKVELFFKWIKQHLRVKSFWGQNPNAVKIQVYCAIIAYCLVAICGSELKSNRKIYEILQIFSISLFDKILVKEMVTNLDYKNAIEGDSNQLIFSYF
jgi:hypothetical protein